MGGAAIQKPQARRACSGATLGGVLDDTAMHYKASARGQDVEIKASQPGIDVYCGSDARYLPDVP